jgi:arylsulfatase A-like enzyme
MTKPNIIYILADDMGYGDLGCNNPDSRIPTPNLDRLARQGMRFTDTHAGSSVCTPSRYNILTGRYSWRSRLEKGIVWQWDAPLIEPDQRTVAHLLREEGYRTQCIGKWHLGWNWSMKNGKHPNDYVEFGVHDDRKREELGKQIIYGARIDGGPVDRGFDSYFGVDVPNFPPYTWFENNRLTEVPTVEKPDDIYGCPGQAVPNWVHQQMIPEFTRRAVDSIERQAGAEKPFFLYFPLTSPHSPVVPNPQFMGMSGAGNYGDFVCEVDWVVGQVNDALERTGLAENTLLIFTSDNGPEDRTPDDIGVYRRCSEYAHSSMGGLRGIKRDAWEGGHRVPFLARWPEVISAGVVCDQLTTLGDFMATCAQITRTELRTNEAEDSVSLLPLLRGKTCMPVRDSAVHHSCNGKFAIRKDNWVLIDNPNGGDNVEPNWFREERGYEPHGFPAELFDLDSDLSERYNRYSEQPEIVAELTALLAQVKNTRHPAEPSSLHNGDLTE